MKTTRQAHSAFFKQSRIILILAAAAFVARPAAAQITVSNLWSISTADGRDYVTTSGNYERGITVNPVTGHTILVSRADGQKLVILDTDTGAELGRMNADSGIVTGGTYNLNLIGAADDGNLYLGNLITSLSIPFRLYRYTNESSPPVLVYSLPPSLTVPRWGDSLDVRGSGIDTEILIGSAGTQAAILRPTDENLTNFVATVIDVRDISAGQLQKGVSFYTNNTFVAKTTGSTELRLFQYDHGLDTGFLIHSWTIDANIAGVKVATTNVMSVPAYIVAGVRAVNATSGQQLMIYDISGSTPVLLYSSDFPAPVTANVNAVGAPWISGDRVVAVDTQNGVKAARLFVASTAVPPSITAQPPSQSIIQGGYSTLDVFATGTQPLSYQWYFNGSDAIPDATNSSLVFSNIQLSAVGDYSVRIANAAGAITSATAVVTVVPTALSDVMTPLWALPAGSYPFLTATDRQRGLAYRPQSDHLILVSRAPTNGVHVLDGSTGAYLYSLLWSSDVITGGYGDFQVNTVALDDDGGIYVGNLTLNGTTTTFRLYLWPDDSPTSEVSLAWEGDPGAGNAQRWGDTLAARGPGFDPFILLASRAGNIVSVLRPAFGAGIAPYVITTDGANGNYGLSVAFGEGDTFWGKATDRSLRHLSYDIFAFPPTSTTLHDYPDFPNMTVIGVDTNLHLLAAISQQIPNNLRLYDIADLDGSGLVNIDTEFFPSDNLNANGTGTVVFGTNRIYALDSNNGIIALQIDPTKIPVVLNYARDDHNLTLTWNGAASLQVKETVTDSWTDVTGASSGFTTNLASTGQLFFQLRRD